MRFNNISTWTFCALLLPSLSWAADSNDAFAIKGAGVAKCSKFIEFHQKKDNTYLIFGGWLEGYLTAINQQQGNTFDLAPWQSTQLMLIAAEAICKQKPDMPFQGAVQILVTELMPQKITQGGKFIPVDKYLYQEEVIRRIKETLKSRNLYSGNVNDAQYDEKLKAAVKKFQKSVQQPQTGLPDQGTLYELFKAVKQ